MSHDIPAPTRHPILGIQFPAPGKTAMHLAYQEYECEADPTYAELIMAVRGMHPGPSKRVRTVLLPCTPWRAVTGFQEAEEAIVGHLLEKAPRYQHAFAHGHHLNAAASIAASRNRRGVAYNVLINPRDGEQFVDWIDHGPGQQVSFDLPRRIGGFTYFGTHPGRNFLLYHSPLIPERQILCVYRGNNEHDALASYVETIDSTFVSLNNEGWTDPLHYATTLIFDD